MSRFGSITLDWGGDPERAFRLGIREIGKLQEKLDAGPSCIAAMCLTTLGALRAMRDRDYVTLSQMNLKQCAEITHVREVLMQGLLGANMAAPEALRLVREWVEERPLDENLISAFEVCQASIYGTGDEKAMGEPQAADGASPISPAASTASERTASTQ